MADTYPEEPIQQDPLAPPHPEEHPERHEHSDVSIRALTIFFIAFVAVAIIVHVGLWVLFEVYEAREEQADIARRQSALVQPAVEPPRWDPRDPAAALAAPPLQGIPGYHDNTPADDTRQMAREHLLELNRFHLNDDGSARIPIDTAMDLLVQYDMLQVQGEQGPQQLQQQLQQLQQRLGDQPGAARPSEDPQQEGGQDTHATSR